MDKQKRQELWTRWLDNTCSSEEQIQLAEHLSASESNRKSVLDDFRIDSLLTSDGIDVELNAKSFVQGVADRLDETRELKPQVIAPTIDIQSSNETQTIRKVKNGSRTFPISLALSAGVALALGLALWYYPKTSPEVTNNESDEQNSTQHTDSTEAESPLNPNSDLAQELEYPGDDSQPPEESEALPTRSPSYATDSNNENSPNSNPLPNAVTPENRPTNSNTQIADNGSAVKTISDLARLTHSNDAKWAGKNPGYELGTEKIHLLSGNAQLLTSSGVTITIVAPAELQLKAVDQLALSQGRITALVPSNAVGFQVETPTALVVDLGTEFTVDVEADGATGVRVKQGLVEMSPSLDASQLANPPAVDSVKPWRLSQDNYKWISSDGTSDIDWRLELTVQPGTLTGSWSFNGETVSFENRRSFLPVLNSITGELAGLQKMVLVSERDGTPFHGSIKINDQEISFENKEQSSAARRFAKLQLQKILSEGISKDNDTTTNFDGVININGEEIRFRNMDEYIKKQLELLRQ